MNSAAATETPKKVVGLRRKKVITPVVVPEPVKKLVLRRKKCEGCDYPNNDCHCDDPVLETCCTHCDKTYDPKCNVKEYNLGRHNAYCDDCTCDDCGYGPEWCECDKSSVHTDDPEVCAFCLLDLTEDDERFYCDHREQWFCEGCNEDKSACDAKSCDACHPELVAVKCGECGTKLGCVDVPGTEWFCEECNKQDEEACDAKPSIPEDDGEEAGQCADCEVEIYKHEVGTTALKDGKKLYCEDCTH